MQQEGTVTGDMQIPASRQCSLTQRAELPAAAAVQMLSRALWSAQGTDLMTSAFSKHLDVEELPGHEVHDVDVEVICCCGG